MNYIDKFLKYYEYDAEIVLSKNTISAYKIDIYEFMDFIEKEPNEISNKDIFYFKASLEEKGLEITTINRKLVAISRFFNYLQEYEKINIKATIKLIKQQEQIFAEELITNKNIKDLVIETEKNNDLRAKTLILSLFYTGARISEILQIQKMDVTLKEIRIKGKGSKYRYLYIPDELSYVLEKYLTMRQDNSEQLFTGERGAINRHTAYRILEKYGRMCGIEKAIVHPHALRHLYSKNIHMVGGSEAIVKQLLGHSLQVTDRYMSGSKKELFAMINKLSFDIDE